jgi:hypothetical protein
MRGTIKSQSALAKLARRCATKSELAKHLRGADLEEAWRIKQIQRARWERRETAIIGNCHYGQPRYGFTSYHLTPRKLLPFERKGIKGAAWKATRRWPWADHYAHGFCSRIAARIKSQWAYSWRDKNYSLSLRHVRGPATFEASRSASSYDNFYITIGFDLLRHEAVWIGGLLTIRAKADARKHNYPCQWFERRKDSPGLLIFTGRIENRNFHREDGARKTKRNLERLSRTLRPASGWVSRASSIAAGNCANGTDSWIRNKLIPYLINRGVFVGDLTGACIHKSLLFAVERSLFTQRILKAA